MRWVPGVRVGVGDGIFPLHVKDGAERDIRIIVDEYYDFGGTGNR
jgi:hypothetical protein